MASDVEFAQHKVAEGGQVKRFEHKRGIRRIVSYLLEILTASPGLLVGFLETVISKQRGHVIDMYIIQDPNIPSSCSSWHVSE